MKKIIGLVIIAAFLVVLAVTHSIAAQSDKVEICHVVKCIDPEGSDGVCVGTLKTISKKNLSEYIDSGADEVDHYVYLIMDAKLRDEVEEIYDVNIPSNCDCVFGLDSTGYEIYYENGKKKIKLHKF